MLKRFPCANAAGFCELHLLSSFGKSEWMLRLDIEDWVKLRDGASLSKLDEQQPEP